MSFIEFLLEYYIYILSVLVVIIIGVIGFLVDTRNKEKKQKEVVFNSVDVKQESKDIVNEDVSNVNVSVSTPQTLNEVVNNGSNIVNDELNNNVINGVQTQPEVVASEMKENVYMNQQSLPIDYAMSNQVGDISNNNVMNENVQNVVSSNDVPVQDVVSTEMVNANAQMMGSALVQENVVGNNFQSNLQSGLYDAGVNSNAMYSNYNQVPQGYMMGNNTPMQATNNVMNENVVSGFNYQQSVQPSVVPVNNSFNQNVMMTNNNVQNSVPVMGNDVNNMQSQSNGFNMQASNVQNGVPVNNVQSYNANGMMGQSFNNNMVNNNPVFTSDGSQPFDVSNMFGNNQQ